MFSLALSHTFDGSLSADRDLSFFLIRFVLTDYLYRAAVCGERFVIIFISCFVLLKL